MKPLNAVAPLALGLALAAGVASAEPKALNPEALTRLQSAGARVTLNDATGTPSFIRLAKDEGSLSAVQATPEATWQAFVAEHGAALGITDASELVAVDSRKESNGRLHASYRQVYQGVPVFGAVLRGHFADGRLYAVNGTFVPGIHVSPTPTLKAEDAARKAAALITGRDAKATRTTLYIYREGLVQRIPGANRLAYEVEVTGKDSRDLVYIDAHSGKLLDRITGNQDLIHRTVYDSGFGAAFQVWDEGDVLPYTGIQKGPVTDLITYSQYVYDFYFNSFYGQQYGLRSFDGADSTMHAVNRNPAVPCPNANWNGVSINFCPGTTTDDVTAHEWTHAYTQYTHGLIYAWQSGALNESYSDIFGESIDYADRNKARHGTDTPLTVRTDAACTAYTPLRPKFTVNAPASVAGPYVAGGASFGAALTTAGVTGNALYQASNATGCSAFTAGSFTGLVALIDRGTCSFATKTQNAQNAGAVAAVIVNNVVGPPANMASDGINFPTIPAIMISLADGTTIKAASGVNATVGADPAPQIDSVRWLIGEDSAAFGGAIRDMWNPNCYSNPGRVGDSWYFCATTDGGGVHTNSGVSNHGFALLVDGGTFNGVAVKKLNWVKTWNLYLWAMGFYQTPLTGFPEHSDALEASCQDLMGLPLYNPQTGAVDPAVITGSDCAAVSSMIAATEMRLAPSQCHFLPAIGKTPPPACDGLRAPNPMYSTDFADGGGFSVSNVPIWDPAAARNWGLASGSVLQSGGQPSYPGNFLYAADTSGNCSGGAGDKSVAMWADSPDIPVTTGGRVYVSFKHYIASENFYDGIDLWANVNGGWIPINPSDFVYSSYNSALLNEFDGNFYAGFSGTDNGSLLGSFGTSVVDLGPYANAGDTLFFEFEYMQDGCGSGVYGSLIDSVNVYQCVIANLITPATGTVLPRGPNSFSWNSVVFNASEPKYWKYWITVGSTVGGADYYNGQTKATSATIDLSLVPPAQTQVYVSLRTRNDGVGGTTQKNYVFDMAP